MSKSSKIEIIADIGMTVLLLLLMAYEMVGRQAHKWLGVGIFALFAAHHILNAEWSKSIFKCRDTAFRIFQTVLIILAFLSMLGSKQHYPFGYGRLIAKHQLGIFHKRTCNGTSLLLTARKLSGELVLMKGICTPGYFPLRSDLAQDYRTIYYSCFF